MKSASSRSRGRVALAAVFALLGLDAWVQVLLVLLGFSDAPRALTVWQVLVGISGAAAASGSWTGRRWSPVAALSYGIVTGGMLAALPALLALEPAARGGVRLGALGALFFGVGAAWYLRRAARAGHDAATVRRATG